MTRRLLLKCFAGLLAYCLTPWRARSPGHQDTAPDVCEPASSIKFYEDVIELDQHRGPDGKCGVKINGNQVFYPGCRKVVFNSKDYGVVVVNSSKRKVTGDPLLERFEELLWKEVSKN